MRELFIEELTEVTGGQCPINCVTTDGCCEEGPYELCCIGRYVVETLDRLIDP